MKRKLAIALNLQRLSFNSKTSKRADETMSDMDITDTGAQAFNSKTSKRADETKSGV